MTARIAPEKSGKPEKRDIYSLEVGIAKLLRVGVILSGLLMLIGWMLEIQFTENPFLVYQTYQKVTLVEHLSQALQEHSWGIVFSYLGLFVLISLPILRVLATAFLFIKRKDWLLAAMAVFVLSVLLGSFFMGIEI